MKQVTRRALLGSLVGAAALSAGGAAVMKSEDIAPILARAARPGQADVGFRQGILTAWDPETGRNTVEIAGQPVTDLPTLAASTIELAAGDIVGVLRYRTGYWILGRIANAGGGSLQTRAARVDADEFTTSTSFGNLDTVGPTLENVFIGSSRQCLVLINCKVTNAGDFGVMGFQVSGASSIPADVGRAAQGGTLSTTTNYSSTITDTILLTADDGLNAGLNTFQAKYKSENGKNVEFQYRRLAVIPF